MPDTRKPSHFYAIDPMSCVFHKSEHETVARNCMAIMKRKGDDFCELTEEDYSAARLRDGASPYSIGNEMKFFRDVQPYTVSADKAATFSPSWA